MSALEHESGANRVLVAYYFGSKAGLVTALIDGIFVNPQVGLVEEIRAEPPGAERTARFLEWQQRVSSSDRTNRMLYELLPHALHDPEVRARFAEEYRAYRTVEPTVSPRPRRIATAAMPTRWRPWRSPSLRVSPCNGRSTLRASTTSAPGGSGARSSAASWACRPTEPSRLAYLPGPRPSAP